MTEHFIPRPRQPAENEVEELRALCHDLRQYVSAALLLATPTEQQPLEVSAVQRLQIIQRALSEASTLLDSATRDVPVRHETLDLAVLVQDCVTLVEVNGNVRFVSEALEMPLVSGDPHLLRRAVNNLVDNAFRAAGDHGEVVVRVGSGSEDAWVEVSDDGPGFGRIPHGTGRGLAVVSQAARGHGGRLEILSGRERGTLVRLELPRDRTPAQWTPARTTPARSTPARPTPARPTPARSTPARSTPARPTPVRSTTVRPRPVQPG